MQGGGRDGASVAGSGKGNGRGVALRADATAETLPIVAAVATGAAEAMNLDLEPAVRLQTIALEAAGNVVAHAYPDAGAGPLEMEICRESAATPGGDPDEVHLRVSDQGIGMQVPPSGGGPPGLGLSMISTLAERFRLTSGVTGGTSLDATIDPDAMPNGIHGEPQAARQAACELEFGDGSFIQPVLGRALAAQVSGKKVDLDSLEETIELADAIAEQLRSAPTSRSPLLRFERLRSSQLRISVGPYLAAATEGLAEGLRGALAGHLPSLSISTESAGRDGSVMRICLPV